MHQHRDALLDAELIQDLPFRCQHIAPADLPNALKSPLLDGTLDLRSGACPSLSARIDPDEPYEPVWSGLHHAVNHLIGQGHALTWIGSQQTGFADATCFHALQERSQRCIPQQHPSFTLQKTKIARVLYHLP
jgi:hypothetical protein